jgi:hypothetical protein
MVERQLDQVNDEGPVVQDEGAARFVLRTARLRGRNGALDAAFLERMLPLPRH